VKNYVNTPVLAGHIYLLAAFGLMELAIREKAPPVYSYYDGLYACRLTELGAYILGLKADYTPPESSHETNLLFDENGPNILIDGNLALAGAMLDKYAVKVNENRYQFSPGKFLKDCKTQGDLASKIIFFKQTVGHELPPFWNDYLEQLNQNRTVINRQNNVVVYKLPAENKPLHRLIAQDNLLRPLIIKAEQFYIVIEKQGSVLYQPHERIELFTAYRRQKTICILCMGRPDVIFPENHL
jgi:hypothetical protein